MLREKTLAQIVIDYPETATVFDKFDIDFSCHGNDTIETACRGDQFKVDSLQSELLIQIKTGNHYGSVFNPDEVSLSALSNHIVQEHHNYVRSTLPILLVHAFQVSDMYGQQYPELIEIKQLLTALRAEFEHHMMKEEEIVFPRIRKIEEVYLNTAIDVDFKLRLLYDPLKVLSREHVNSDKVFHQIRRLAGNYIAPENAGTLHILFLKELKQFETDMHLHVHLENNILFPKVEAMVRELTGI